jgi:hypothetical protein
MDRGNSVQVLGKATLILDALADEHEVGASRLADLSGEPRSMDMVEPGSRRAAFRR